MLHINFEALRATHGLNITGPMNESELLQYSFELDNFIETLPSKTYELTKIFMVRDFIFLRRKLQELTTVLNRIYAEEAMRDTYELIDIIEEQNKAHIDVYLEKLIVKLTTLSIDIQLAQHHSGIRKKKSDEAGIGQAQQSVLVVDDESVILNSLKQVIDTTKYRFVGTLSALSALRYLETHEMPGLCILDIEMPDLNGYELATAIISKAPSIPIIFLTSNGTRENVQKAIQIGASDFLVKPANKELLLNKLDSYLG